MGQHHDMTAHLRRVQRRVNGRMHVRCCDLARLLGVQQGQIDYWERSGRCRVLRVPVRANRDDPSGVRCYVRVSDALRLWRWRESGKWRAWTDDDVRRLRVMVGKRSWVEIGARLGRTSTACLSKAKKLGISTTWTNDLLPPSKAAVLLGVAETTVQTWCDNGQLRCYRPTPVRGDRRIERSAVMARIDTGANPCAT